MQALDAKFTKKEDSNAAIKACFLAMCLSCFGAGCNRMEIRQKFGIEGNYFMDCLLHMFCCVCAVTQEWQHVVGEEFNDPKITVCKLPESK